MPTMRQSDPVVDAERERCDMEDVLHEQLDSLLWHKRNEHTVSFPVLDCSECARYEEVRKLLMIAWATRAERARSAGA